MRQKIELNTMSDVQKFINVTSSINAKITLEDDDGNRVSATSLLGALYTMEWANVYCCCEKDIGGLILEWTV